MTKMNCPKCQKEMDTGQAQVRGTVFGFLMVGFSHQHLFFYPDNLPPPEKQLGIPIRRGRVIVSSGCEVSAYRCDDCAITVLLPQ